VYAPNSSPGCPGPAALAEILPLWRAHGRGERHSPRRGCDQKLGRLDNLLVLAQAQDNPHPRAPGTPIAQNVCSFTAKCRNARLWRPTFAAATLRSVSPHVQQVAPKCGHRADAYQPTVTSRYEAWNG